MGFEPQALLNRFRRLGVVAVLSFLTNILLTVILTEAVHLSPEHAFAIVLVAIFTANFIVTRYWVFKDRVDDSNVWSQLIKCVLVSASFRCFEWFAFFVLIRYLHVHYSVTLIGVLCLSFVCKSLIYERYVFR